MPFLKSRIAPTPSGFLHAGNAFSFLLADTLTHDHGGKLLLRIDDLDTERKRDEFVEDIFESLRWLGITWDEGPADAADFEKNWSQKTRMTDYHALLGKLSGTGRVFACSCSRKQLALPSFRCECHLKNIPLQTENVSWRIHVPANCVVEFDDIYLGKCSVDLAEVMGPFVIRRRDGIPAYQVASLADDLHSGINFIVRGNDLLHSTAAQVYLASLAGENDFGKNLFLHHPLVEDDSGSKLSKSAGASSLRAMRMNGVPAEMVKTAFRKWRNGIQINLRKFEDR
ncbi:MAG TPA: glutamate--tRNA ligase family protein [Bacteroidia bacterium]|nr:glutamate--tRNA ligase family protein [Bacteroidia bacterium]